MEIYNLLLSNLEAHALKHTPKHAFNQVYLYSLIPAGKLFRPLLSANLYADIKGIEQTSNLLKDPQSDLSLICSSLEIHHTYTLIHDDLPCMDNDLMRRGRPSTHAQFGEWQALLAGDGLQALSYRLLSLLNHPAQREIFKYFSWALGAKGLIHGQALDLDINNQRTIENILIVHKLKTARLIQTATLCAIALANKQSPTLKEIKLAMRMGEALGMTFQLLDDLIDLYEDEQDHEKEINPWFHFFEQTNSITQKYIQNTLELFNDYNLTKKFIGSYLKKSYDKFESVCHINEKEKYSEILSLLKRVY